MKLDLANFRTVAANLPVKGEICDIPPAHPSTQTETDTEFVPLIQKVGGTSIAEIDRLMAELQLARDFLQSERERIEQETIRYTNLTQMTLVTAKVISDAVSQWQPARNQQPSTPTPLHSEGFSPLDQQA
jgi:chemotaxis regulatin CheY-phosphate phosphatase CheZ